jgi:hypothetical protein
MSAPTSFADEIREEFDLNSFEVELLLRDIVLRDQTPTYAEAIAFKQKMNWDEKEVRSQLRRMHSVLRQQGIAGSPANREAIEQEAATATAVAEKEIPKIDEQIAKLQAKRDGLEREKRLAAKRCEEQRQAVQQLRELAPKHVWGKVNHAVNAIESTIGRQILDMGARIGELECCLDPSRHRDEQAYFEALQRSFRPAVIVGSNKRALSPEWPAIRSTIQRELDDLKEQIEPLKAQRQQLTEQAELLLDFYADPENWNN